jgi:hypothetical protein
MATDQPFTVTVGEDATGFAYPKDASTELIFGSDFAHSEFVIPMARFKFYDATGADSTAPAIYIRLGGTFSTQLGQGYQEATGIFGSVTPGEERGASLEGISNLIGAAGSGITTAYLQSAMKSLGAGIGFVKSAGQSGKSQVEFLTRKLFNSFQQLIYQGPRFRSFQLPFNMKPTSYEEAIIMRDIMNTFRIASSPRGKTGDKLTEAGDNNLAESAPSGEDAETRAAELKAMSPSDRDAAIAEDAINAFNSVTGNELMEKSNAPLTFGYPDMVKLELILYKKGIPADKATNTPAGEIVSLFISDFCMIENVGLDYGAQNKMVFLTNPTSIADGEYFASEVNMTIALRESVLITADYATAESQTAGRTIF